MIGRGYTGHEHFFEVNLIHMNGRMYDANLGRFLSPDNYIQDPFNTQSYNRYGYVLNNPLKYVDPSGEIIEHEEPTDGGGLLYLAFQVLSEHEDEIWEGIKDGLKGIGRLLDKVEDFFNRLFGKKKRRSRGVVNETIHASTSFGVSTNSVPFDLQGVLTPNGATGIGGQNESNNWQSNIKTKPQLIWDAQSQGRPDLGYVGNEIRARAGSDFSQDMFENYWLGKGDVHLSQSRFNDIVSNAGAGVKLRNVTLSNGQPGVARWHSFYSDSNPYALVLGGATIYYQGGSPVGFQDGYDFNWRWMWGEGSRTVHNELKTRAVSTAGFFYGAEPFNMYYGIRP